LKKHSKIPEEILMAKQILENLFSVIPPDPEHWEMAGTDWDTYKHTVAQYGPLPDFADFAWFKKNQAKTPENEEDEESGLKPF
jgi:hypothetical protein